MTDDEADYDASSFGTVDFIYPEDEPQEEGGPDMDAMRALVAVVFELGQWSGTNPIKVYAANVVMRKTDQSVKSFALEHRCDESGVHKRVREAHAVVGLLRHSIRRAA